MFIKLFTRSLKGFSMYVKKDFIKNYIIICLQQCKLLQNVCIINKVS